MNKKEQIPTALKVPLGGFKGAFPLGRLEGAFKINSYENTINNFSQT